MTDFSPTSSDGLAPDPDARERLLRTDGAGDDTEELLALWALVERQRPQACAFDEREPWEEAGRLEALLRSADLAQGPPAAAESREQGVAPAADAIARADATLSADATLWTDLGAALSREGPGPSPAVLAAARAALRATEGVPATSVQVAANAQRHVGNGVAEGPAARMLRARRRMPRRPVVGSLAALLLLGVGLFALLSTRSAQAEVSVALDGLERINLADAHAARAFSGARPARVGERFTAGSDELLALHVATGGSVILARGESVDVARSSLTPAEGPASQRGVLRLASGEVLLDARLGPVRLLLARPGDGAEIGLLSLAGGAAHVALGVGARGEPAVALTAGAQAQFVPTHGAAQSFAGPVSALLSPEGLVGRGPPVRALFRELELLGGPLKLASPDPFVEAARWRCTSGRAHRGGTGLRLWPALHTVDPSGPPSGGPHVPGEPGVLPAVPVDQARLAWRPDATCAQARGLRLALAGPAGLLVSVADLEGVAARLPARHGVAEPGVSTLELALPEDWFARLGGRDLELVFRWPASADGRAPTPLRFDGLALSSATPLPAPQDPR